ncbi:MAG TPA: TRAP transporter small permease [Casimicrobiaceae bacterium]|nr:TRAP transporter small permease [Casimicrobiaceae bacterium]
MTRGVRDLAAFRAWSAFRRTMKAVNALFVLVGGLLILTSCIAISNEVVWRYYLHAPHTWSLELNIFLLIAATFLAAGGTQAMRGHVGTEVLQAFMPARWNRRRIFAGDILSLLVCAFIAIKIWAYAWQAWSEGWTTDSVWAPKLWIPYGLMAIGMTLLAIEYVVQIIEDVTAGPSRSVPRGEGDETESHGRPP